MLPLRLYDDEITSSPARRATMQTALLYRFVADDLRRRFSLHRARATMLALVSHGQDMTPTMTGPDYSSISYRARRDFFDRFSFLAKRETD